MQSLCFYSEKKKIGRWNPKCTSNFQMLTYVNLKFYWTIYSLRFLRRKKMSNIEKAGSSHQIPYIKEIERLALKILRENPDDKEKLKEILEDYASRYAREYNIRV